MKDSWTKNTLADGTIRYRNSEYFIDKPAHSNELPCGYRYAVYLSGAGPSGIALRIGVFKILQEAKDFSYPKPIDQPTPDYLTVEGEGAPQYTFFAGTDVQLSLL